MVEKRRTKDRNRVSLVGQVADIIAAADCREGDRLFEARLAAQLDVSRAPIRAALDELRDKGFVTKLNNKGYVLAKPIRADELAALKDAGSTAEDQYMAIANDRLDGKLPQVVKEQELVRRYGLSLGDVRRILGRILSEGWVERLPGYGWRFSEMLDMPDANAKLISFRRMFEPRGLLDPAFVMPQATIDAVRRNQVMLLEGELSRFTPAELFFYGCEFHETLAAASGNPFMIDALKRVNTVRRLYTYRASVEAYERIRRDVIEHLAILDLIEKGEMKEASKAMDRHLAITG